MLANPNPCRASELASTDRPVIKEESVEKDETYCHVKDHDDLVDRRREETSDRLHLEDDEILKSLGVLSRRTSAIVEKKP